MKNKNETNWRFIAIAFIIISIIEFGILSWAWNTGTESIEMESECAYNICEDYETYLYDDYEEVCYCYINNELEHQEYMGGK